MVVARRVAEPQLRVLHVLEMTAPRDAKDIAEQIEALLSCRALCYVMKRFGVDRVDGRMYGDAFTVDRSAILDYLSSRNIDITSYARYHGLLLAKRDGKWIMTEWDEKFGPSEMVFESEFEARSWLQEYTLKHTYTGRDFSESGGNSVR